MTIFDLLEYSAVYIAAVGVATAIPVLLLLSGFGAVLLVNRARMRQAENFLAEVLLARCA